MNELQNQANDLKDESIKAIAKTYKLSLSQIEVVKIEDKEYFKFYDSDNKCIKMFENRIDRDLNDQFINAQKELSFAQNEDELKNAKNIFEYESKYNRKMITFFSVKELENNLLSYRYILNQSDKETLDAFLFLLKNVEVLRLEYINIEKSIAIDENQNVLYAYLEKETNQFRIQKAEVEKYEDKKVTVDADGYNLELVGIDYDQIMESIDIEVPSEVPIEVAGEIIDISSLNTYYQYPELLDRQLDVNLISERKRTVVLYLIEAYKRKMAKKQIIQNQQKRLVLKLDNNKAAYINAFVLMMISAFAAGVIFTISFLFIKMHF